MLKEVSHGKITLPSVKTKGKINNKGTKTFILKFKTPPDGSYGKVGLKINSKKYHPYWNSTWSNRKKITLTGTSSESQTDYQILLNVTYEPKMNSDFSDVRFCNDTDQLSAWLESKVNESYALIWVKFPHTPADGETEDYWMYYGNSGAEENWDIDNTMEFGDDFLGSSLDTEKWVAATSSGCSVSVNNGNLLLNAPTSAANNAHALVYTKTFTFTKAVIEMRRKSTAAYYMHAACGSGDLCIATTTNKNIQSGYYFDGYKPTAYKFRYVDDSCAQTDFGTDFANSPWTSFEIHKFVISDDASNNIRWYIENVLKNQDTNNIYLTNNKN